MDVEQITGVRKTILQGAVDLSQYSSSWILLLVGVVTLVGSVVLLRASTKKNKLANLPPGPRNWPIIGAILQMEPKLYNVFDKFAKLYGPIVYFRLGVQDVVVVSTAEAAEELLKHKDAEFADRDTKMTASSKKYTGLEGALFPFKNYDDKLKLLRKLFVSEISTVAKLKTYETLRAQEVASMVEDVFRRIQSSTEVAKGDHNATSPAPMAVRAITDAVPLNVMFSLAIGKRFDSLPPTDELREFPDLNEEILEIVMKVNIVDFFPWLRWLDPQGLIKRMQGFGKRQTRYYERILETNRRAMMLQRESRTGNDSDQPVNNSFVRMLLRAQEKGAKISDIGIMGSISSILNGGIDTTGSQIEWVLLLLARHPKLLKRLQDEIDAAVGKERPLEEADFQDLPFLNAFILETMRLHAVVPFSFPHVNLKPATLCGYNIPANTAVFLNMFSIGRDPKRWKDPLEFNPDRFMVGAKDSTSSTQTVRANGNYFQLLPFSGGRRVCPGYNLAHLLLMRAVGALAHAFDWSPPPGWSPEDLSVEDDGAMALHPAHKLFLVPIPRLQSCVYKSNITGAKAV